MIPTTEKLPPPPRKNRTIQRGIFIVSLSVLLLITASRVTSTQGSPALMLGNLLAEPSSTPTAAAIAAATATGTATSQPTATKTAAPTATSTSTPTATRTAIPSSTPETAVTVSGDSVNLRTGPSLNYSRVRKLPTNESLTLLGRSSDNAWLYVKTSDGQEGWIEAKWVDLAGINIDYHSIKTPTPPETTIKVGGKSVNLRTGPGISYLKLRMLTYNEPLLLLGKLSDNSWLYVKTSDGLDGWIMTSWANLGGVNLNRDDHPVQTPPPTETATPVVLEGIEGPWIDIDLSEQRLYAYNGTQLVDSFLVSTGIYRFPTETGQFHIDVKLRYSDMRGDDYFLPDVPYTMYYYGDYAIHGTYWHHSFGTPMSRGCINMDTGDAEWLFSFASVGTLVNIHN